MIHIYGFKGCSFCEKAVDLLTAKGKPHKYYDIKTPQHKEALNFFRDQGFDTVPQIYEDNTHIGGYTDLQTYLGGN